MFLTSHLNGDLNHSNEAGFTALHSACSNGLTRLTSALLEHGARPNLQTAYGENDDTVYRSRKKHTSNRDIHCMSMRLYLRYIYIFICRYLKLFGWPGRKFLIESYKFKRNFLKFYNK